MCVCVCVLIFIFFKTTEWLLSGTVLNVGNIKAFTMQYLASQSSNQVNGYIIKNLQNCRQV